MLRKISITIGFWIVAILLVASVLVSLNFSFSEALFVAVMFLPGAFAVRFMLFKVSFLDRKNGCLSATYVTLGILLLETFLIILANIYILKYRSAENSYYFDFVSDLGDQMPAITINPFFIALIITVLCIGDYYLEQKLKRWLKNDNETIRFNSNRTPVTLYLKDIKYVESNDSETWVYAADGEKYRNKTPISHWEGILGEDFVRIHRSYIVNRNSVTSVDNSTVSIGEISLPVSRKYKEALDWAKEY